MIYILYEDGEFYRNPNIKGLRTFLKKSVTNRKVIRKTMVVLYVVPFTPDV